MKKQGTDYSRGFVAGIPIILGYFFVAIGVGVYAVQNGMTPFQAALMSLTNLTSAGEISAISVFGENGGYIQLVIAQVVINIRYALMAISLSQKRFSPDFGIRQRLLSAYGITDEIFAVLINEKREITGKFTVFLIVGPIVGWTAGTITGALAGEAVSPDVSSAMSVLIYAMLISIVVPEAKKSRPVLSVVLAAAGISSFLHFCVRTISSGYAVVISSVLSAVLIAWLFPVDVPEYSGRTDDVESDAGSEEEVLI